MLLLPLLLAVALAAPAADDEVREGSPAPRFSLRALNPEVIGAGSLVLDQLVGDDGDDEAERDKGVKAVLISFFASWCTPCRQELPFLVQLDERYRKVGLRVISISIDQEPGGIEAARKLALAAKVRHPVLSDRLNLLVRRYLGEKAPLPSVVVLDKKGIILRFHSGYAKDAPVFLLAEVQAALGLAAEPRPQPSLKH